MYSALLMQKLVLCVQLACTSGSLTFVDIRATGHSQPTFGGSGRGCGKPDCTASVSDVASTDSHVPGLAASAADNAPTSIGSPNGVPVP